jgi:DNA-binding transcriptional MerR regulator
VAQSTATPVHFLAMSDLTGTIAALRDVGVAPHTLDALVALAERLLAAAGQAPERATTEHTVRYYVRAGVVRPPVGRGASARWEYPHLLDLLEARLAQQEGMPLERIAAARVGRDDTALEQQVAARLQVLGDPAPSAGDPPPTMPGSGWHRLPLADGAELHLPLGHPLLADPARLGAVLANCSRMLTTLDPEL